MTKQEYRDFIATGKHKPKTCESLTEHSVTDPTYAQSGREILFNPLPYDMKPIYHNGVPLDQMQPFDRMYVDKHEAFQSAKELDTEQKNKVRQFKQKQNENSKPANEPTNPT